LIGCNFIEAVDERLCLAGRVGISYENLPDEQRLAATRRAPPSRATELSGGSAPFAWSWTQIR
jgi:hypothetical protein